MVKRLIYPLLPAPIRVQGVCNYSRSLYFDLLDLITGRTDRELPPRRLNVSGEGSFRKLGNHNLSLCREFGNLNAHDSVLDLGCGIGRTALAMATFLQPPGTYTGLDAIRFAIRWCQRRISSKHSNFRFVHADIFNLMYNPRGKIDPGHFSFPFVSESFTFCLATSLFTHLLPAAVERYTREAARVLRIGGSLMSTWFLLCKETRASIEAGSAHLTFPHKFQHHAQRSLHAPEQAVAFDLDYVKAIHAQAGLAIQGVYFGGWSGYKRSIDSGQDIIVATRIS